MGPARATRAPALLGRALVGDTFCHGEIEGGRFFLVEGDVFAGPRRSGRSLAMDGLVLGTPLADVRFVNVMGGFLEPGTERRADAQPMWLPKACNYATGDGGEIQVPGILRGPVVIESELAVVVGRPLRKASPVEAGDAIFGWSVFNDVTAPEYGASGYWAVGKSIDGFASWGPWIRMDLTERRVLEGLAITATVNGEQVQAGNTRLYRFSPSEVLSHVSHRVTLLPGDVVALGTPPPPPEVVAGDRVVCTVEEVGSLHNYVVPETLEPPSTLPGRAPLRLVTPSADPSPRPTSW